VGDAGFLRDKAAVLWYVITDALCTLCIIKYYMEEHRNLYSLPRTVKGKGEAVLLQAWSGPEGSRKLRFPDFFTMAHYGDKVVNLMHRPPLPPGKTPGTHFCYRLSQPQGQLEGLCQRKSPMTSSRIEPVTFQFVTQNLKPHTVRAHQIKEGGMDWAM
jgi:hypothetical protein